MIKEIYENKNITLYFADCKDVFPTFKEKSIDLIHTDPPYVIHSDGNIGTFMESRGGRKFYDGIIKANISDGYDVDLFFEIFQKICKNVNYQIWCSKKQFIDYLIIAKNNEWNWQDICLYRNNALPNVRGKYQDKDYCVHLWKGRTLTGTYHQKVTNYHWNIGGKKEWDHPAFKPIEPVINLIQIGSDENDTILDPFMGSCTTGIACLETNRKFIGIEKEEKFFRMAVQRVEKFFSENKEEEKQTNGSGFLF